MNPLICMFGAINKAMKEQEENKEEEFCLSMFVQSTYRFYATHLLHPDDWFSLWRLNCRLASYHSSITQAEGYKQEDKWTFLTEGKALGVPVSPFIDDVPSIVLKHKSIEGGMMNECNHFTTLVHTLMIYYHRQSSKSTIYQ